MDALLYIYRPTHCHYHNFYIVHIPSLSQSSYWMYVTTAAVIYDGRTVKQHWPIKPILIYLLRSIAYLYHKYYSANALKLVI